MKHIWLGIEGTGLRVSAKNALFLTLNIIIAAAIGGLIWAAIGQWMLPGGLWLFAFLGYPAVFAGLFGGVLYLWNNEFS